MKKNLFLLLLCAATYKDTKNPAHTQVFLLTKIE